MKSNKTRLPLAQDSDRKRILQRAQERVEAQGKQSLENSHHSEEASTAPTSTETVSQSFPKAA